MSTRQQEDRATRVKRLLERSLESNGEGGYSSRSYFSGIGLIGEVVDLVHADITASLQLVHTANDTLRQRGQEPMSKDQTEGIMLDLTPEQVEALEQAIVGSGLALR